MARSPFHARQCEPARVQIVEASLADGAALRSLHITTWMAAYRGLVPESFYRERSIAHRGRDWPDLVRRQRAEGGGVLIARSDGRIDGLCQYGPTEDNDDDPLAVAQVHRLYVHPLRQRQGIGRSLLSRATASLQGQGWSKSRCGFLRAIQGRGRSTSIWRGSAMAAAGSTGRLMFGTDGLCLKARRRFDRVSVAPTPTTDQVEVPSSRGGAHGRAQLGEDAVVYSGGTCAGGVSS